MATYIPWSMMLFKSRRIADILGLETSRKMLSAQQWKGGEEKTTILPVFSDE
jgi:hypothetical protein